MDYLKTLKEWCKDKIVQIWPLVFDDETFKVEKKFGLHNPRKKKFSRFNSFLVKAQASHKNNHHNLNSNNDYYHSADYYDYYYSEKEDDHYKGDIGYNALRNEDHNFHVDKTVSLGSPHSMMELNNFAILVGPLFGLLLLASAFYVSLSPSLVNLGTIRGRKRKRK